MMGANKDRILPSCQSLLNSCLCFFKAIEFREGVSQLKIGGHMRVEANGFLRFFNRFFVLTHGVVKTCQIVARLPLARVCLFPQLKRFQSFIYISDHVLIISHGDIELLAFADALSQFERLGKRFSSAVSLWQ